MLKLRMFIKENTPTTVRYKIKHEPVLCLTEIYDISKIDTSHRVFLNTPGVTIKQIKTNGGRILLVSQPINDLIHFVEITGETLNITLERVNKFRSLVEEHRVETILSRIIKRLDRLEELIKG